MSRIDQSKVQPNKRDRLIVAAGDMIAEKGVRGLRVEEVAERAGVAPSLIYYHFGDRNGLLKAVRERTNDESPSSELLTPDETQPAYARVSDVLGRELGAGKATRRQITIWNELIASAVFDEELRAGMIEVTKDWTVLIADQIAAGQADGSVRPDVDAQYEAELLTSLLDGLAIRWLSGAISRKRARDLLGRTIAERLDSGPDRASS